MRRSIALATAAIAALGACGSPPTEQERNLDDRGTGTATAPAGDSAMNGTDPGAAAAEVGAREGIPGATQGPTAADSDAPYAGDDSRTQP